MKRFEYDPEKNEWLKNERGYCFEDIMDELENGRFEIKKNKSSNHLNQRIFVIIKNNYPFCIPFVEDEEKYFLKTMYKSRKLKIRVNYEK
jgi:uncharacterized DUF497 family protein